jgi:DNA-directed RNA polymerase specialized sigma24 family protein
MKTLKVLLIWSPDSKSPSAAYTEVIGPRTESGRIAGTRLAAQDERKAQIVELLFFGGLTYDETAAVLNISPATIHRELRMAKAWLYRELAQTPA